MGRTDAANRAPKVAECVGRITKLDVAVSHERISSVLLGVNSLEIVILAMYGSFIIMLLKMARTKRPRSDSNAENAERIKKEIILDRPCECNIIGFSLLSGRAELDCLSVS